LESNLEQLISDVNSIDLCEMKIYIHTGQSVIVKSVNYEKLKLKKDQNGKVFLGLPDEGYQISNNHTIIKTNDIIKNKRVLYKIEKDGVQLLSLYLYNKNK
jgi:hypothetical protein